jgi:MFS family permease
VSSVVEVLKYEPRARWFLLANVQSTIGSGAAVVALVVLAFARLPSPWAITLVLLADFLPTMLLGPIFGAVADRWSRRACAIVADLLRAVAFVGIGVIHSFEATVVLALVAGIGTALFSPAVLAALPSLAAPERGAAVTSLYSATRDIGRTLGPLIAAIGFPLIGADGLMIVNGATFAVSAGMLALVSFGRIEDVPASGGGYRALLREAREGLAVTARTPGVRIVLWGSTAVITSAAMINVGELLLARKIGLDASGFAALMVISGAGVIIGSLSGRSGGPLFLLKRRYLIGTVLIAVAILSLSIADSFAVAAAGFFAHGFGNGVMNVYERLIFHAALSRRMMARAFAVLDTAGGWGFATAFIAAGAIIATIGVRPLFAIAGALGLIVCALSALAFRRVWRPTDEPEPAEAPDERPLVSGSRVSD